MTYSRSRSFVLYVHPSPQAPSAFYVKRGPKQAHRARGTPLYISTESPLSATVSIPFLFFFFFSFFSFSLPLLVQASAHLSLSLSLSPLLFFLLHFLASPPLFLPLRRCFGSEMLRCVQCCARAQVKDSRSEARVIKRGTGKREPRFISVVLRGNRGNVSRLLMRSFSSTTPVVDTRNAREGEIRRTNFSSFLLLSFLRSLVSRKFVINL